MRKSCGKHKKNCLGGQYYGVGQSTLEEDVSARYLVYFHRQNCGKEKKLAVLIGW